ncbi:sigma-54-dependent transcriptional regulator [Nitratidesulfovibrio liaohensis]|uniref:sigma-54-dependent transcriptional regulator n=1 Tax=Nitratidesulfovibrio liaohensis TaxID=2604158 RepID=UPI00141E53A2|nr:sigma-54 dependent transcriptional regulator [Nitratidesulfovibrio liaohensis]NHZ46218.1 sigma-54-dependent Fis family transcriptional regulator [Nitratidesulfovibrio liaohensis]
MKRLLVIDDEPGHRLMVRAVMEDSGWNVEEAGSGEEGLELLAQDRVNVVLLDMRMPGMDGQETLARIQEMYPGLPVVMLTAFGTVGSAVVAMKKGAFDYLTKPADNEELTAVLEKAWDFGRLLEENENLRRRLSDDDPTAPIVGASQAMCRVRDFIRQAGPSEATILVMGESGTGKELIAQGLHDASNRADQPLVKVNCAALPGHLLESELFGYMKGAFTGAVRDKPGRFQLARGGTLFLDEIGELPLELQSKLLRALQERVVEPLGAVRPVPVDVRIIAATNRDLKRAVEAGEFREDLFFRLNVLEVVSPPLRDRLEDLPMLAGRLLERLCRKNKKGIRSVSPEFLEALMRYSWPGNVRELENVLERALILSRSDTLGPDSLPSQVLADRPDRWERGGPDSGQYRGPERGQDRGGDRQRLYSPDRPDMSDRSGTVDRAFERQGRGWGQDSASAMPRGDTGWPAEGDGFMPGGYGGVPGAYPGSLDDAERDALLRALEVHGGHRERTADALGISRRTLQYKLKKFGLIRRGM